MSANVNLNEKDLEKVHCSSTKEELKELLNKLMIMYEKELQVYNIVRVQSWKTKISEFNRRLDPDIDDEIRFAESDYIDNIKSAHCCKLQCMKSLANIIRLRIRKINC